MLSKTKDTSLILIKVLKSFTSRTLESFDCENSLRFEIFGNAEWFCYLRQLGVSKTQSPQSKVGGRVRDAAQTELNCVDALQNHDLSEIKLKHNQHTYTYHFKVRNMSTTSKMQQNEENLFG